MTASIVIPTIIYIALTIFVFLMIARLILDLVVSFSRRWRPQGFGLVLAEITFTVTDPPLKFVRRFVPPLRFGGISLDLAWTIIMLVTSVLISFTLSFIP